MWQKFSNLIFLVITVLVILFAVSNRDVISVTIWPVPFDLVMPVFFLCFLLFLAGFIAGWIASAIKGRRVRQTLAQRLNEEISNLKLKSRINEADTGRKGLAEEDFPR